jgi:hypothetical protein
LAARFRRISAKGKGWKAYLEKKRENSGKSEKYMEIYGNIWKYMETYGNIWKYMEICR